MGPGNAAYRAPGLTVPYELFIALRYLRAKRKQTFVSLITFISVAGVAVGVMALTISLALMTGFEEDIQNRILNGSAHITVFPASHQDEFENPAETVKRLQAVPGVAAASAVVQGSGVLTNEYGSVVRVAIVSGIDPKEHESIVALDRHMVEGKASAIASVPDGDRPPILLGRDLAADLGVEPGDLVRLFVQTTTLTPMGPVPRPIWMRVAGTMDAGFYEYNAIRAYVPLESARRIFRVTGANEIEIRVHSLRHIDETERRVEAAMGQGFLVDNLVRQNKSLLSALRWEKLLMFIVISLIVLVAALNIVSTLILMVMEKVRDIGTLVALGATSKGILALFILQGVIIGVFGTLLGLTGGVTSSVLMDHYQLIQLDPNVYFVPFVPFRVKMLDSSAIALLAVAISLVATIYPAWRASRLDPVEALRHG
jgi:lipoprotein-releasing system permease protein